MNINDIKNPRFLKKLNNKELESLAFDMRKFILENVSKTGGHLSSNLGIVDLVVAMLKVFDVENDIFLFDVGHQCYPYKILTGRVQKFNTLRKKDGLSGFQSMSESKYDHFEAGHSSTSISTGLGMAIARDLDHKKNSVISIIGDGSIGNGLAYEALNQIGDLKTKQIIILNDNQMSISKNVGAMHNMLDSIRGGKSYNKVKKDTKSFLNKIIIGRPLANIIHKTKNVLKKIYLRKSNVFSEFGIEYYGPINGHDYKELIKYLEIAKNEENPVILHVITEKGKGYKLAEEDKKGKYHGIGPFNIDTGELLKKSDIPSFSEQISSEVLKLMKNDKDIICITPGMAYGSKLEIIKEKYPKRYIDVGIAEEHGLVLASGLSLAHKKPIVFIYSTFLQRAYDELVHDIARMNEQVLLLIDRAGITPDDGVSHQGIYDIAMMMHIPNMIITSPKDSKEANNLIYTSLNTKSPFAIRFPKINVEPCNVKSEKIKIGSWERIKEGSDLYIITYGNFISKAIKIANNSKYDIGIINARFIKPIDEELFKDILSKNIPIIVYEDACKIGSLGSFLSMKANEYDFKNKIYIFGVEDKFLTHASREELIQMQGLDELSMIDSINKLLKK